MIPLDSYELEERTQAIGRELFAAARHEHAHLSVLNRWTAQVLSWCLADPTVKSAVLRFIDVLPSLRTPSQIVAHVREYFPTSSLRLPVALRLGSELARPGLLTHRALAALVHQLVEHVAGQFIAQDRPEGAAELIRRVGQQGATCSLDVLGERVLSEREAERYTAQCRSLIAQIAQACRGLTVAACGPRGNLSVKPSALAPRFDPISPSTSIQQAAGRLVPLVELAAQQGVFVNLDMEQYELCDLTVDLALHCLERCGPSPSVALGVVIQAYLRDAEERLERILAWLAARQRTLTVRLVKGAYWDAETALAQRHHWPSPVYQEKAQTDRAFERLTQRLVSAAPLVTPAIASHNVRSIAHAMALAELRGVRKDQLEFQLLYGMGDALRAAITARGYPVRIYTPIGPLIPGMAYLVRRILENTANESFLRQDFMQEHAPEELLRPPMTSEPRTVAERASTSNAGSEWEGEPLLDVSSAAIRARMAAALESVRVQFGAHYPLLLGDGSVQTPTAMTVCNPADPAQRLGTVAQASVADVDHAVRAATAAQPAWAQQPVGERVACLRRAAELIRQRRYELAAWTVVEVGKTWREADVEIVEAIEYLEYYSEQMRVLGQGRVLRQAPGERNQYVYQPRGVAAVIAPWNFPAAILMGMSVAALVSGNAVILKPAEQSSIIAAHLARLLRDAGVPAGVVQYLPGSGEEVGAALVQHPGVQSLLFTGSKPVGLSILGAARQVAPGQRFIKQVIAEMGGKNAIIVDDDADLDAAVAGSLQSAFGYAGQKCSAASRLIVHRALYEQFLERLADATDRLTLGNPADPATDIGPLIDPGAQERFREAAAHAQTVGRVAYHYPDQRVPSRGFFAGPLLVTDVPVQDRLAREELFGPLVCIFRAETFEEALALANETDYALTGGVYSRSPSHLALASRAFDVGNLYLNRPITGAMVGRQPFGGHRLSGLGTKAGGPDYLLHLVLPKTVCTNTTRHGTPLEAS